MDDGVKKGIWEFIIKKLPGTIVLFLLGYAAVFLVGLKVYKQITASSKLTKKYVEGITSKFLWAFALLFISMVVVLIIYAVFYFFSRKKAPQVAEGKIDAFIVEQDARSRDNKFNDINDNVQKTYWVLGVGLTSMVDREATLKKMAKCGTKIRLCMMDPDIAVENLCLSSLDNNTCNLIGLAEKIKKGQLQAQDFRSEFSNISNCKDMLGIYHVLINAIHFNEYYVTDTDYKNRIKASYVDLKKIKKTIIDQCGQDSFELKVADSFMPMSLTIADAEEECGKMVVEFHLPFTQYKVLFEISKKDNADLFKVFLDFYKTVWKRANQSE